MLGTSWISLLQRIPSNLHDSLALLTTTGVEVVVQRLLRMEEHFLILRGRVAGSIDAGRVMILPYDQISNIAFNKRMSEAEVKEIFEGAGGVVPLDAAPAAEHAEKKEDGADVKPAEKPAEEAAKPTETPPAETPEVKPAKLPLPSKSVLLERLRTRLAEKGQMVK